MRTLGPQDVGVDERVGEDGAWAEREIACRDIRRTRRRSAFALLLALGLKLEARRGR